MTLRDRSVCRPGSQAQSRIADDAARFSQIALKVMNLLIVLVAFAGGFSACFSHKGAEQEGSPKVIQSSSSTTARAMSGCDFEPTANPTLDEWRSMWPQYVDLGASFAAKMMELTGVSPEQARQSAQAMVDIDIQKIDSPDVIATLTNIPPGGASRFRSYYCDWATKYQKPGVTEIDLDFTRQHPYWAVSYWGLNSCLMLKNLDDPPPDRVS